MKKLFLSLVLTFMAALSHASTLVLPTHTQTNFYSMASSWLDQNGLENLQSEVKVIGQPPNGWGYYAQFGWDFQNGAKGYMGLLRYDNYSIEKTFIFSLFDKGGHSIKHVSGNCQRFYWPDIPSNSNSGVRCLLPHNWSVDRTYSLRVQKEDGGVGGQRWAAYIVDQVTEEKFHVGTLESPDSVSANGAVTYKGSGNISNHHIRHINEYVTGNASVGCSGLPYFGIEWNGPFGNNLQYRATHSYANYTVGINPFCTNVNSQGLGAFATRQEAGPGISHSNNTGDQVYSFVPLQETYYRFAQLECLYNWLENSFPAQTGQTEVRRMSSIKSGFYARDYRRQGVGYVIGVDMATNDLLMWHSSGALSNFGNAADYLQGAGCYVSPFFYGTVR